MVISSICFYLQHNNNRGKSKLAIGGIAANWDSDPKSGTWWAVWQYELSTGPLSHKIKKDSKDTVKTNKNKKI